MSKKDNKELENTKITGTCNQKQIVSVNKIGNRETYTYGRMLDCVLPVHEQED